MGGDGRVTERPGGRGHQDTGQHPAAQHAAQKGTSSNWITGQFALQI